MSNGYRGDMDPLPTLIDEATLQRRVGELADEINEAYAGTDLLVLVGVLKGAFMFMADLARRLTVPHRIEFIAVSSYGDRESEEHTGAVRLLMDVRHDLANADVLIIEDIVDTGYTIGYLRELLAARRPRSLRLCTLLHKPDRTEAPVDIDYLGFTIPDVWVVGFGLDYAEQHRTLPYVAKLPPERR
jgi:hypoxanthine phosphoribosyltransferase